MTWLRRLLCRVLGHKATPWYRGYTCLRCMRYFEEATDGTQQT